MIIKLILISIGLAMDAFAVSLCKGLAFKKITFKNIIIIGLYFGLFQAFMPLLGYLLGSSFQSKIQSIDHWISFILLCIIGINMVMEAAKKENESKEGDNNQASTSLKVMLPLAVATSIDALIVGISFGIEKINIWLAISFIGIITFLLSMVGVKIGHIFGSKYKKAAQLIGGTLLILMGVHVLIEHLFF